MRYIILLFILFVSCQKEVSATLRVDIKPGDSIVHTGIFQYPSKLYKDSKFYRKIPQPEFPVRLPQTIKMDSLEKGNYTLEYPDLYGNFIKKSIVVNESKIYKMNVYPDLTDRVSKKSIIANLKNGEELNLKMISYGCFHSYTDTIHISKQNNQLIIRRGDGLKILSDKEKKYLTNLENNVRLLKNQGNCTTSDVVIFMQNGKNDTVTDSGCQFKTFEKFIKFLDRNGLRSRLAQ